MKSLNFTKFKKKLISGEKKQTIRCKFIPAFEIDEIIQIKFKKKPIFQAKVKEIYPKRLREITEVEAIKDGFKSKERCLEGLKEINKIKSLNRFCFIIRFEPVAQITDFIALK